MQVDISLVFALLSLILSAYLGISNLKKNDKKDVAEDTTHITTVIVKLENISNDISEMKNDLRELNISVRDHSIKIAKMEQQIKALEKTVFTNKPVENNIEVIRENKLDY